MSPEVVVTKFTLPPCAETWLPFLTAIPLEAGVPFELALMEPLAVALPKTIWPFAVSLMPPAAVMLDGV